MDLSLIEKDPAAFAAFMMAKPHGSAFTPPIHEDGESIDGAWCRAHDAAVDAPRYSREQREREANSGVETRGRSARDRAFVNERGEGSLGVSRGTWFAGAAESLARVGAAATETLRRSVDAARRRVPGADARLLDGPPTVERMSLEGADWPRGRHGRSWW